MASLIASLWLLNFDDSRTQIGQQHGAEGSGHGASQVEDAKTVEWAAVGKGALHSAIVMLLYN